jgi:Cu2+-exporting ATPase
LGDGFAVVIDGERKPMCCKGCEAVAQAILDSGLGDFYRYRTEAAPTGQELVPEFLRQVALYDNPEVQKSFVRVEDANVREAALILEGITCAACVWLNERHIARLPGVLSVQINYSTHRARVRWDESRIHLSDILRAVSDIGYLAHPYDPGRSQQLLEKERKQQLRYLGVAGALGMQVMMIAWALYHGSVEPEYRTFFHWASLLLTIPVLTYSAQPFFKAAWRDVKRRQAGMDVPVALGITLAFAGSLWVTVHGGEHVYYESVTMFVFLLLAGRYFEFIARKRAAEAAEALVHLAPMMATRLTADGGEEVVPAVELNVGDRVLIRPGESVPADGVVMAGASSANEALLTGESLPIAKTAGSRLIAGSINMESVLQMQVEQTGQDTVLSGVMRLLERAQTEKPTITQIADRAATWFVAAVLVLASGVALFWWQHEPALWLPITVSVLVVTCPCALSLATPTAISAASGHLLRLGLLTTRGHALETLARATHFVFDKTGTLTAGRLTLREVQTLGDSEREQCLTLAAALERHSEHPIARALLAAAPSGPAALATEVENVPGGGLSGLISGARYFIGTDRFITERTGLAIDAARRAQAQTGGNTVVWLADSRQLLAAFALGDELRAGARDLIDELRGRGKTVWLLTGDNAPAAARVAQAVGITNVAAGLKPADKLARVKALQAEGAVVAMIGDGVNDAPVLAAAQVSVAMGGGTAVALASADMILLSDRLPHLTEGMYVARKTVAIIRENLGWAIGYNLIALPAAAMGWVPPWLAALGMSASSLLVVANALRLHRPRREHHERRTSAHVEAA